MRQGSKKKKYEGQALAIAMVILVVSSLVGMSVYSRSMKDKGLALEERASAEALEVTDVILDKLTQYPINLVIDGIVASEELDQFDNEQGIVLKENKEEDSITRLLIQLGILQTGSISDLINPLCPVSEGSNEYQLTLKESDSDTYYEIKPGNVWALPIKNLIEQDSCALNLKLAVRGDTRAGFVLTKIYCNYDSNGNVIDCKDYNYDDILNYCLSSDGGTCNNEDFLDTDNWIKYNPDSGGGVIDIDVLSSLGEYALSEIRVKSVFGTIGVSYTLLPDCITGFRMYQLRVTANCSGVYRGKEILIPETEWHNALFDYVLFNGEGPI